MFVAVAVVLVVAVSTVVVVVGTAAVNPLRWCCGFMLMSFLASSSLFDFMFMFDVDEKVVSDDDRFEKELFECEISFEWGSLCVDYRITIR